METSFPQSQGQVTTVYIQWWTSCKLSDSALSRLAQRQTVKCQVASSMQCLFVGIWARTKTGRVTTLPFQLSIIKTDIESGR